MRILTTAVIGISVTASCVLAQTSDTDPARLIQQIEKAYQFQVPYESASEEFLLKDNTPPLEGLSPAAILAARGERTRPQMTIAHPIAGELTDTTDPIQRRIATVPFGTLSTRDGFYTVNPRRGQSTRTLISNPLALRAMAAPCAPANIAALVRWKASESSPSVTLAPDGLLHLAAGDTTFLVDPRDSTVVGWTEHQTNLLIETRFVDWQPSPIFAARFPKLGYTKASAAGKAPFYTVREYATPKGRPDLGEGDFVWTKYADSVRDSKTGAVIGPDNEPVAAPAQPERLRSSQVFQADEQSVAANAKDPSVSIVPKTHMSLAAALRVGGIVCLLLGGAWSLRKRLGANT